MLSGYFGMSPLTKARGMGGGKAIGARGERFGTVESWARGVMGWTETQGGRRWFVGLGLGSGV